MTKGKTEKNRKEKNKKKNRNKMDNSLLRLVLLKYYNGKEKVTPYSTNNKRATALQEYLNKYVNPYHKPESYPSNSDKVKKTDDRKENVKDN